MACSWAIAPVCAQDISQIAKSDPLIITGSIGTNNTYFHSSAGLGYMSPLSNSFFANLNFNIYGFSMPFSIYFSNDNLNFSYPQFSFNLSPSYKNFTAHIGQSSMPFSQYVLNMSFNGVGLEWRDKQFRASAFYGVLRRAVNDNPDDPTARIPQYRRYGWGISAGYSKGGNSIDLYFLRAYDSESSIDERWRTRVRPQENLVLGLKGQLSYKNFLSLAANVATSAFTADRESQQVMTDEARRFDKIFETRYTSRLRFAGDATLGLTLKGFNASIFYKYIQPDYVSLGTYYTSNNYHTLGLSAGTTLFRRLTLSASFSGQEDNLAKQQLYTTRGYVYNAMASLRVSDRMNVTAMYNGYLQSQGDGTAQVNDTTEIHRVLHSFSLVPTYNLPGELFDHTISLSANYTENRDLNKFSVGQTDVKTLALGASYNLNVKPWETNFTFSLSHQNTKGFNSEYSSDVASISTGRSFLKEKNLSTSATVSLNYNEVRHHSKSLSMGVDLSASYTLKKYHSFSLGASFSQYGDVNLEKTRSTLDNRDVRLGVDASAYDQVVAVPQLSDIMRRIPKTVRFAAEARADASREGTMELGKSYTIQPAYSIMAPLAFDEGARIVYNDTIDGWTDDLEDIDLMAGSAIELTANVENKIPAYLTVSATAIDVHGKPIPENRIKVEVSNVINASEDGKTPVVTPLKIRLTEGEPGSVALVDGLTFRIEAASGEEGAKSIVGQTINAYNHTLKARDIKVRLVGKIIVNKD